MVRRKGRHLARSSAPSISRKWVVLLSVFSMLIASVALADQVEGDIVGPETTTADVTAGESFSITADLYIVRQGTAAESVTWGSTASLSGSCPDITASTPSPLTLELPDGWKGASPGTLSSSSSFGATSEVVLSGVAGTAGGSCTVTYSASATGGPGNPLPGGQSSAEFVINFVAPVDQTPPVITATVSGTVGDNGWYVSDVDLSWTVVDPDSLITSTEGCESVTIASDQGLTDYTCTATSAGGTASETVSIKRDATPPTITGQAEPAPNDAGWNNTDVQVTFDCNDNLSGIVSCGPDDTVGEGADQSVTGAAEDEAGNTASTTVADIDVDKTGPVAAPTQDPEANTSGWNNTDVDVDWNWSDGLSGVDGDSCTEESTVTEEGEHDLSVTCADVAGNLSTANHTVKVDKTAPVVSNVGPTLLAAGTSASVESDVEEDGSGVGLVEYSIDGGATWVEDDTPVEMETPDVVELCVRATDFADNESDPECVLLAVYDPSAGFVTGGGWIDSPLGAYIADPGLTGKASFGFVAKYKKGANVPDGNTEFQFKAGDLNFKSTSYEWLVVAGQKAQFKGEGTVNGEPGFGFMLSAVDGTPDTFRIKINGPGGVVYDNQPGASEVDDATTTLGGGSIVVHTPKGNGKK